MQEFSHGFPAQDPGSGAVAGGRTETQAKGKWGVGWRWTPESQAASIAGTRACAFWPLRAYLSVQWPSPSCPGLVHQAGAGVGLCPSSVSPEGMLGRWSEVPLTMEAQQTGASRCWAECDLGLQWPRQLEPMGPGAQLRGSQTGQ